MPEFHEMVRVKERPGIPAWQDIMALDNTARPAAIALAAKAVWSWMHARAESGDKEYQPAILRYRGGLDKPVWSPDGNLDTDPELILGYRWDGIISNEWGAYVSLWPSLAGKMTARPSDDPETQLANAFRSKVGTMLRHSRNVVCVYQGGGRNPNVTYSTPQWFVAAEYSDNPVVIPRKAQHRSAATGISPGRLDYAERKLTAQQAGEDRAAAPVIERISCRAPGCKSTFRKDESGNRKAHEMARHPELTSEYYPLECEVRGCYDRFATARGLGIHLGTRGHGIHDEARRTSLIEKALEKATRGPEAKPEPVKAAAVAQQPEPAVTLPPEPTAPEEVIQPAATPVVQPADRAVGYLMEILTERDSLRKENSRLRAQLEEVNADARIAAEMRKLFMKQGV